MKRQTTLDFVAESQMEYSRLPSISTGAAYNSRPFDRRAISRGGVVHGELCEFRPGCRRISLEYLELLLQYVGDSFGSKLFMYIEKIHRRTFVDILS